MRRFRDEAGVEWQVLLTERSASSSARNHHLPEAFRDGWLVFESVLEKRRLAPVPPSWESATDAELAAMCAQAVPQTPRRGRRAIDHVDDATLRRAEVAREIAPAAEGHSGEQLQPELRRVQERLEETLAQVCDGRPADQVDTGELIRIEETLALAADTAKKAVSLRRRLRADREEGVEPNDATNEQRPDA